MSAKKRPGRMPPPSAALRLCAKPPFLKQRPCFRAEVQGREAAFVGLRVRRNGAVWLEAVRLCLFGFFRTPTIRLGNEGRTDGKRADPEFLAGRKFG
jgi:hypothetical protein